MTIYKTSLQQKDIASDLNALKYLVRHQILDSVNTILVVKVIAVNGDRIDVRTVLKDLADNGQLIDTYEIPDVPYIRWQYGLNAIKASPKVGDVGLLLISQQDISGLNKLLGGVCQTVGYYNVGNGIYIGGLPEMNDPATQSIEFSDNDITITGTGTVNLNTKTDVTINSTEGNVTINATGGNVTINTTTATVNATTINLGGDSGVGVAKIGSKVTSNGLPDGPTVGFIAEGSTITKTL